jgi:gliding motility-associated-like protein
LGDPIVNITFGSGNNPGAPLKAATTSYQYVSYDCPGDGYYTVRNNTINCFGSTWHSLTSDHTGDTNGYFMLINASYQPSAFYLDTVKGLCAGTTYEFAAWIANVLKPTACSPSPIQPNLTFTIEATDGTVLKTYNTNTIGTTPGGQWQQSGFYFTTPANASDIVLRIFNNAPGGCGNDLALDDITFRPCGPQLKSSFAGSTVQSMTICEGDSKTFNLNCAVSAGFNNPSFQWQQSLDGVSWTEIPGSITSSFVTNFNASFAPGNYHFRLTAAEAGNMGSQQCRIASNALTVTVAANPLTTAGSNGPVCEKNTLQLNATGGSTYQWNGPNNFSSHQEQPLISNSKPLHSGKYYVLVTNTNGCHALDSVTVLVKTAPVAQLAFSDTTICEGENIQLISSGGTSYDWTPTDHLSSPSVSSPSASPVTSTGYRLIVQNNEACTDTAIVQVNVLQVPVADAGPDRWVIEGSTVQLIGKATGENIFYSWSPHVFMDNPLEISPFITPLRDTTYVLTVISNSGCGTDTDSMKVIVYKDVYIPSAFSPNNDGLNDTWNIPVLTAFPGFELTVFNRQGQIVFRSKESYKAWDGKYKGAPQPGGVYVYQLDLKDGNTTRKGTLTLIR